MLRVQMFSIAQMLIIAAIALGVNVLKGRFMG